MRLRLLVVLVLLACGAALLAQEAPRFPHPQFESGYAVPEHQPPPARSTAMEWLDVAVLALALGLASWLALGRRSRRGIFVLTLVCLAYFGFWKEGCVCAVGSLQNIALALADTSYGIPVTAVAFFVLPLITTLLFGRTFCAAVCPLGAAQDVVIFRPVKVPAWLEASLGLLAHAYLGLAVLFAATGGGFLICRYDPFVGFFRLGGRGSMILLGASLLLLGLFVARPYCRFLCPYGVLLGWMSRLSWKRVTITAGQCIDCRLCEDSCPFNAIHAPADLADAEPPQRGRRRMGWLLGLTAALVLAGALLGWHLGGPLSGAHPSVNLQEVLASGSDGEAEGMNLEVDAFRESGNPLEELEAEVEALRNIFRWGGLCLGVFLGLVFGIRLVNLARLSRRTLYEMDAGACLSCARCYIDCPQERFLAHQPRGAEG